MLTYFGVDWLAMVLTFIAIYQLGNRSRHGFVVMILGNLAWVGVGVFTASIAMVLANLGFIGMNVRGYLRWTQED